MPNNRRRFRMPKWHNIMRFLPSAAVMFVLLAPAIATAQVQQYQPNPNFPGSEPVGKAFSGFLGVLLIIGAATFLLSLLALRNALNKGRDGHIGGPAAGIGGSVVLIFMIFYYATFLNGAVAFLN